MANVKVAYPGLYSEFDSEAVLNQYESGLLGEISKRKFFLFVGTIETRKNLKIVIQSFIDMKKIIQEMVINWFWLVEKVLDLKNTKN